TYRASAWVYVPTQDKNAPPCLAFVRGDWSMLVTATTAEKDKWVELKIEYTCQSDPALRLALYQEGQKPGLGGAVMYWDNIVVDRQLGAINMTDGITINPYVVEGLQVTPAGGMKVKVALGKIDVAGTTVAVAAETAFDLPAPRVIPVRDEVSRLTDELPQSYHGGTALRACTIEGIGLNGALIPDSLVLKAEKGPAGRRFVEGQDWRADKQWGRVGRLPGGEITADTDVFIDYDYSLQRLDMIEVRSDGQVALRSGAENLTIPAAAGADQMARPLCNLYLPAGCRELTPDSVYPIGPPYPAASDEEITHNASLIPNTLAKLEKGGDFTLLFWGDSVTCGGTASAPEHAFPLAFTTWLRGKYPQARVHYVNAGTGGWNTDGKLPLIQEQVLDHKPDLVVIEFVNDMGMDREHIFKNYTEALTKLRAIGAEVIILTPHFTRPDWMGEGNNMRTPETRAAVGFMKEFAAENKVGLADASRRWEHLWIEGQPYLTWLNNAINHPDDRGHWLFVEELQKFFP
ncbi:MAG: GDSL-type esterase/lipase family protein, partial [Armatimonadota bacterium]